MSAATPVADPQVETIETIELPSSRAEALEELVRLTERRDSLSQNLDEVVRLGQNLVQYTIQQWGPFDELPIFLAEPVKSKKQDGRSTPNPIKNLKIAVSKTFSWAKKKGTPVSEVRSQVLKTVEAQAVKDFSMAEIPQEVLDYIDEKIKEY